MIWDFRRYFVVIGLVILSLPMNAQQETQFTQYMFNGFTINPAYAGTHEVLNASLSYRRQWAGLEGAPSTQVASIHSPLKGKRIGLGGLIMNDEIGVHRTTRLFAAYAYRIPFKRGVLSLGLQGGFLNQNSDFSAIALQLQQLGINDPNFNQPAINTFTPEFGAGAYYYTDRFYVGLSAPKLVGNIFIRNRVSFVNNDSSSVPESFAFGINNARHYFLNGGAVFEINRSLQIHPSFLLKMVSDAPAAIDLNTNVVINNVLWLGVSVRSFETLNFITQIQLSRQFRFGYSYDTNLSGFAQVNNGSHEIVLNFLLSLTKNKLINPRIF